MSAVFVFVLQFCFLNNDIEKCTDFCDPRLTNRTNLKFDHL